MSKSYILRSNGDRVPIEPPMTLDKLQAAVGGYIELVPTDDEFTVYLNEEGKLFDLPFNPEANAYLHEHSGIAEDDFILGDVVFVHHDDDLPDEEGNYA